MKTGTKLGLAALALALGSAVLWFYLARQVNLPENRTVFVVAFLAAAVGGIAARKALRKHSRSCFRHSNLPRPKPAAPPKIAPPTP